MLSTTPWSRHSNSVLKKALPSLRWGNLFTEVSSASGWFTFQVKIIPLQTHHNYVNQSRSKSNDLPIEDITLPKLQPVRIQEVRVLCGVSSGVIHPCHHHYEKYPLKSSKGYGTQAAGKHAGRKINLVWYQKQCHTLGARMHSMSKSQKRQAHA